MQQGVYARNCQLVPEREQAVPGTPSVHLEGRTLAGVLSLPGLGLRLVTPEFKNIHAKHSRNTVVGVRVAVARKHDRGGGG